MVSNRAINGNKTGEKNDEREKKCATHEGDMELKDFKQNQEKYVSHGSHSFNHDIN